MLHQVFRDSSTLFICLYEFQPRSMCLSEGLDLVRAGGRSKDDLPLPRPLHLEISGASDQVQDLQNLLLKAHVKKAIDFIKDDQAQVCPVERFGRLQVVKQSSRCCDEHRDPLPEPGFLRLAFLSPSDAPRYKPWERLEKLAQDVVDLLAKFSRGGDNKRQSTIRSRNLCFSGQDKLEDGHKVGQGLARPCLGAEKDIDALKDARNAKGLDLGGPRPAKTARLWASS